MPGGTARREKQKTEQDPIIVRIGSILEQAFRRENALERSSAG